MNLMASNFDPTQYLVQMGTDKKGNPKMYLQAAHRILWFRTENPLGNVSTEPVQLEPYPVFRAVVTNGDGVILASGYGCAQPKAGSVYAGREIEKAETAAISRALGHAGYGSQFGGDEDDSDHLAESPTARKPAPKVTPKASGKTTPQAFNKETATVFTNHWYTTEMLSYDNILEALNVGSILKWSGTIEEAHAVVQKWCDDNPPVEDKTA
jgi:hypothetical protein